MKSGYKLVWSERALADLRNIIDHRTENWTQKEIRTFAKKLDKRLEIIAINPRLFPQSKKRRNIRRSVLTKQTVIYYEAIRDTVTLISLFDTRQAPSKLKL